MIPARSLRAIAASMCCLLCSVADMAAASGVSNVVMLLLWCLLALWMLRTRNSSQRTCHKKLPAVFPRERRPRIDPGLSTILAPHQHSCNAIWADSVLETSKPPTTASVNTSLRSLCRPSKTSHHVAPKSLMSPAPGARPAASRNWYSSSSHSSAQQQTRASKARASSSSRPASSCRQRQGLQAPASQG
jgi:hypothetical protein